MRWKVYFLKGSKMEYREIHTENCLLNEIEIKNNKSVIKSMPQSLMLIPTSECNLRCIMCERVNHPHTLPFEELKKIYFLIPYLKRIDIQGGEPFILDYFKNFLSNLVSHNRLTIGLLTNGLLLSNDWLDLLIRDNVSLSFSIDSINKKTYEYIRKGSQFEVLLKNIDSINEISKKRNIKRPLHSLNAVVMKSNYKELSLLPRFCKDRGFTRLVLDFLRPETIYDEDIFTVKRDSQAIDFLTKILPEIKAECENLEIGFDFQAILPFLHSEPKVENKSDSQAPKGKICMLPWKKLFIDSDGTIKPDCVCEKRIGNLKEVNTIDGVWNNKMMQSYRVNIIKNQVKDWCNDACLIGAVGQQYRECS